VLRIDTIIKYINQVESFRQRVDEYAKSMDKYAKWFVSCVQRVRLQQEEEEKMDDLSLMTGSMHASQDITGTLDFQGILDELTDTPKLTKKHLEIMVHTVSSPGRNWFGTGYDCSDAVLFGELVSQGLATAETAPNWMGDDVIFSLTDKGKEVVHDYGQSRL
jgi:hypothetical protein